MPDDLHYYCSNETFLSIVKHRELWLTALSLSNDRMEGKWALERYLDCFRGEKYGKRRAVRALLDIFLKNREALGVCFSEKDDLLSQWRGYADDGSGVSISFKKDALEEAMDALNSRGRLKLSKIKYGGLEEHDFVEPIYSAFEDDLETAPEVGSESFLLSVDLTDEKWDVTSRDSLKNLPISA